MDSLGWETINLSPADLLGLAGCLPIRFGDGRFGGSRYHFLHHAFLECNYGTSPVMPFDHLLGSYRDDPPKFAKIEGDTSKGAIFE